MCVTNAANMVLALALLEDWSDLACFGHTLQLAMNTATCQEIVGYFKHSVVAMGALCSRQKGINIPWHSLLQDVATRQNLTQWTRRAAVGIYAVIHEEQLTSESTELNQFSCLLEVGEGAKEKAREGLADVFSINE